MLDYGYITPCDREYHITKTHNERHQYPEYGYIFCLNEQPESMEYDTTYMYWTQLQIVVDILYTNTFIIQLSSYYCKKYNSYNMHWYMYIVFTKNDLQ